MIVSVQDLRDNESLMHFIVHAMPKDFWEKHKEVTKDNTQPHYDVHLTVDGIELDITKAVSQLYDTFWSSVDKKAEEKLKEKMNDMLNDMYDTLSQMNAIAHTKFRKEFAAERGEE